MTGERNSQFINLIGLLREAQRQTSFYIRPWTTGAHPGQSSGQRPKTRCQRFSALRRRVSSGACITNTA